MDAPLRILHVDMDAFFAAVEVLDNPELKGKPVIIGAPPNARGVVSTASYEARKFGVHSAMPSRTAAQKCPHGIFLPVRGKRYGELSRAVMEIFYRYTPDVEPLSVDEAFLDVRGVLWRWPSAIDIARDIQNTIDRELGLSASIGVAPNKFLAKLCSDLDKPHGLTIAPTHPDAIAAFLAPLPVQRIWGVGKKTQAALKKIGIHTIGQLQQSNRDLLVSTVGNAGADHIQRLAFGRDQRSVHPRNEAKSISGETTFSQDQRDPEIIRRALIQQVERVGPQLRAAGFHASTATMKIRFTPFETYTRQLPLSPPTHHDKDLIEAAGTLLDSVTLNKSVRLIGFGVSGLHPPGQLIQPDLFSQSGTREKKHQVLDETIDHIRSEFGKTKIRHGSALPPPSTER